jgi:DNA transposition AAA+ family ATPase
MNTETEKFAKARELYFSSELTQAQIAERVGCSQKTISHYINTHKWNVLKRRASVLPTVLMEQMYSELKEMNDAIARRPAGRRFATVVEAEIRRKTMMAASRLSIKHMPAAHTEVLLNFALWVQRENPEEAMVISRQAEAYLRGELNITEDFTPYNLPADEKE